jgi:ceramide glucosyltransferase
MTIVLWLSVFGLFTGTVFLFLVLVSAVYFRRQGAESAAPGTELPMASVLKPLHGSEPRLRENLESFFRQDHPRFEIVFGARHATDPALEVVRELQGKYPGVATTVVLAGEPSAPNAKVCALEKMAAAMRGEVVVVSDSDVHVSPDYLRAVVAPLLDAKVGLVTCPYRGVPIGGLWSRLEAMGMSIELMSGVLVANMLEGMRFALGPTMALRRTVLEQIGGFGALAHYCADDYVLGNVVAAAGYEVVLSHHVVEHMAVARGFADSLGHQVRWMKSTRYSRPKGHVGTVLTFAMIYGVVGAAAALALGHSLLAAALFAVAFLNRVVQALAVGWGIVQDDGAARLCWLYPMRDLLGFFLWCASFTGSTILWRGERYRLSAHGKMVTEAALPANPVGSERSPA